MVDVAPGGHVIHRFDGLMRDLNGFDPSGALAGFLIDVQVRLHVPEPWGSILTGVAGLAMLVAAISGMFIHRAFLTTLFTIRKRATPVLAQRDALGAALDRISKGDHEQRIVLRADAGSHMATSGA